MRISPLRDKLGAGTIYEAIGDTEAPWVYTDVDAEHAELRKNAGVIDHCAIGLIAITGDTEDFLARVLARDVEYLSPEQCTTSLILDTEGRPVDIVTVYALDEGVLLETSFGRGEATAAFLESQADGAVTITSINDRRTVIGIEGPYAWGVVGRLIDEEFTALPYESVVETDWNDQPILFARSGFTGEYGYKVILDHETAAEFWDAATQEVEPVGQAALEVAMLEVRQPIFYRECGVGDTVLSCGWNWLVDLSKREANGRDALDELIAGGSPTLTIGFATDDPMPVSPSGAVFAAGERIGRVVHAAHSSKLGTTLGIARVDRDFAAAGLRLEVETTASSPQGVTSLSSPYVVPTSWSVPVF
jgi:aminomethyltransferase